MKPALWFAAGILCVAGVIAQEQPPREEPYESLVKDMLAVVDEITKILKTVKDRESADTARPDLKKAAELMLLFRKQADEMKQPSKEEKDRLEIMYAPRFEVAVKQLREASIVAKGVPGGEAAVAELAVLKDKEEKQKDKDKKEK